MKLFTQGFLLGAIGITVISCFNDVLLSATELVKGFINTKIIDYNAKITDSNSKINAIGFQTQDDEGEEYYDNEP